MQQMRRTVKINPVKSQIISVSLLLVPDKKTTQLSLLSRSTITQTLHIRKKRHPCPLLPHMTIISKNRIVLSNFVFSIAKNKKRRYTTLFDFWRQGELQSTQIIQQNNSVVCFL